MSKNTILFLIGVLLLAVIASLVVIAGRMLAPGGGGSSQVAPDFVKGGETAAIELNLSVWGSGGNIQGRYTDIVARYRVVGESNYRLALPQLVSLDAKHEKYLFSVVTDPRWANNDIEYFFELKLDGYPNKIVGMKKIHVE